jgi:hypothetical protein
LTGSDPWLIVSNALYPEVSEDNMLAVTIRDTSRHGSLRPVVTESIVTESIVTESISQSRSDRARVSNADHTINATAKKRRSAPKPVPSGPLPGSADL